MEITCGIPVIFPNIAFKFAIRAYIVKIFRVGNSTHWSQMENRKSIAFWQEAFFETNFEKEPEGLTPAGRGNAGERLNQEHSFSRSSSRTPSENRLLLNLASQGRRTTFLKECMSFDPVIVTVVCSSSILIFSSAMPGSSARIQKNFPSSRNVVSGSVVLLCNAPLPFPAVMFARLYFLLLTL
jgi:hypothetical protein